jgi:hypothetical protein
MNSRCNQGKQPCGKKNSRFVSHHVACPLTEVRIAKRASRWKPILAHRGLAVIHGFRSEY